MCVHQKLLRKHFPEDMKNAKKTKMDKTSYATMSGAIDEAISQALILKQRIAIVVCKDKNLETREFVIVNDTRFTTQELTVFNSMPCKIPEMPGFMIVDASNVLTAGYGTKRKSIRSYLTEQTVLTHEVNDQVNEGRRNAY